MTDIKQSMLDPRIVDGEPVCSEECSHAKPHAHWACVCHEQAGRMVPYHGACIPGIRRQRDEALAEVEWLKKSVREILFKISRMEDEFAGDTIVTDQTSSHLQHRLEGQWKQIQDLQGDIIAALAGKE